LQFSDGAAISNQAAACVAGLMAIIASAGDSAAIYVQAERVRMFVDIARL